MTDFILRSKINEMSDEEVIKACGNRQEAAEILLQRYANYLVTLVRNFPLALRSLLDEEDLIQASRLGLIKAVYAFDEGKGVKFLTFMVGIVHREIISEAKRQMPLKVPRDLFSLAEEEKNAYLEACASILSLSQPQEDEDGEETIFDIPDLTALDEFQQVEKRIYLQQLMSCLNPKERQIVEMLYYNDWSYKEVAEKLNISEEVVKSVEAIALEKMRAFALKEEKKNGKGGRKRWSKSPSQRIGKLLNSLLKKSLDSYVTKKRRHTPLQQ